MALLNMDPTGGGRRGDGHGYQILCAAGAHASAASHADQDTTTSDEDVVSDGFVTDEEAKADTAPTKAYDEAKEEESAHNKAETPPEPCPEWCLTNSNPWVTKCGWVGTCGLCGQCAAVRDEAAAAKTLEDMTKARMRETLGDEAAPSPSPSLSASPSPSPSPSASESPSPSPSPSPSLSASPQRASVIKPTGPGYILNPIRHECPAGQRFAAERECLSAVQHAASDFGMRMPSEIRVVNTTDIVPAGCSYSNATGLAVFNIDPVGGNNPLTGPLVYQRVCGGERWVLNPRLHECAPGRRNAKRSQCEDAVRRAAKIEAVPMESGMVVADEANVPPGCSYSPYSRRAIFNKNPVGGDDPAYRRACVRDDHAHGSDKNLLPDDVMGCIRRTNGMGFCVKNRVVRPDVLPAD